MHIHSTHSKLLSDSDTQDIKILHCFTYMLCGHLGKIKIVTPPHPSPCMNAGAYTCVSLCLCVQSGFMGKEENRKQRPWWLWKQFPVFVSGNQAGNSQESYQNNDSPLRKLNAMLRGRLWRRWENRKPCHTKTWEVCARAGSKGAWFETGLEK